ncbi:hypothetical protein RKD54_003800 [Pseudarthrobacter sp. SLBN-100]
MPLNPSSIAELRSAGQQVLAVLPSGQEVFQGEIQAGGHAVIRHFLCGNLWQGGHIHRHGTVGVAPDTDAVAPFAVVQVLVLVAQDGLARTLGKLVDALKFGQRGADGVLVAQRQQRDFEAHHLAEFTAPETCA